MQAAPIANGHLMQSSTVPIAAPDSISTSSTRSPMSSQSSKNTTGSRGRRERPCDGCRKRKSKCVVNEGQKNCAACGVHGQECTYVEDPQPRKRKVDIEAKEGDGPKRSRSTASSINTVPDSSPDLRRANSSFSQPEASVMTPRDIEGVQLQHYGTHIGPTTELEPILLDLSTSNGNAGSNDMYRKADGRTAFLTDPVTSDKNNIGNTNALRNLERLVGVHSSSLITIYLSIIHPNFPIIHEEFFRDRKNGKKSGSDPTLLAAVYALTLPWLGRDNSRKLSSPIPDVGQVEDLACKYLTESFAKPTISAIQAGLLLMQRPDIDSKTLNTQLVGIAYELGLHLDCSAWELSSAEKGLRKRLAWALYMQDKWCSLIHGRPSTLYKTNWAVQPLTDEDFGPSNRILDPPLPISDVERGRSLFTQMVNLTEILSTVIDTFFTLQAMQEVEDAGQGGTRLILERAKPVQIRLKDWFARLPSNLKMDSTMTGYLHLAYFATEITLHRCIIRSLESSNGDRYLTHICRSAAKTRLISAMDFVNRLRADHLNSFWYFPSKVNFALIGTFGSLLLATAPCQEEADFYSTRLSEYRWTISVSSKTINFLSFAIDSLDSSSTLLANLPRKPSIAEVGSSSASSVNRSFQNASPPRDEMMTDASNIHLITDHPRSNYSNASGLVSPSTSTSSGSTSYQAYVEAFPGHMGTQGHR